MLPFAQNASTRFISPTKTPEYLAAGKPVVSTPVRDVAEPYGRLGLARIAADAEEFCEAIDELLEPQDEDWLPTVDEFLRHTSWDETFGRMWHEVERIRTRVNEEVVDV
jgi:UDP-galactopyranose mutase